MSRVHSPENLLNAASSQAMEATLSRIRHQFRHQNGWLPMGHPYAHVIGALESNSKGVNGTELAEYIASSIPLHVADGWMFLARAFDAIKSGDQNTAAHLAYYAELRAAMSLLASEGIGVFNNRHVAIGPAFTPTDWAGVGTHPATWNLLSAWADDPGRVATLLTAIRVDSRTISEWFDEAGVSASVKHVVGRQWLKSWSIDLSFFPIDRDLRNHTSYRPSRITPNFTTAIDTTTDVIDPLLHTWEALEPSVDNGGSAIDKALLYRALSFAYNEGSHAVPRWGDFIDRLQGVASGSLQLQLKDPTVDDYYVLKWANNQDNPPPMQAVLSRAILLLRIANGVCAQRLAHAQVTRQDLQFWWTRLGEDGGLWPDDGEPASFADLWAEVDDAIVDTEAALQSIGLPATMSAINQVSGLKAALTQYSRAPLWLLGVD